MITMAATFFCLFVPFVGSEPKQPDSLNRCILVWMNFVEERSSYMLIPVCLVSCASVNSLMHVSCPGSLTPPEVIIAGSRLLGWLWPGDPHEKSQPPFSFPDPMQTNTGPPC